LIPSGRQSQGRQGARPANFADGAGARRQGHRI